MGFLDSVKNRFGRGNQDEYDEEGQYYEDEYYEDEEGYAEEAYYEDEISETRSSGGRSNSVFDDFTPLVSMSDVRSQELPRYTGAATTRSSQPDTQIRTSLPYVGNPAQDLEQERQERGRSATTRDYSEDNTGQLSRVEQDPARIYGKESTSDPLLKRHSLSNTGDFSATSPAYYASRSGVGHVRPAGQARRTHKFREAVVISPESYAEAEQVAINLRRGNAVVLVLTQTRPELAKRILDFSFGAAAVAEGQVASIGERIYALTSDHPLTDTELELLQARGII